MKTSFPKKLCVFVAVAIGMTTLDGTAAAQVAATKEAPAATDPGKTVESKRLVKAHGFSAGLVEVIRMFDAGVAPDVLKSFIEGSATKYEISANDVIAMKKKGVPDEVTAAVLLRVHADRQREVSYRRQPAVMPRIVQELSTPGRLDPESYEFFVNHHLYPRTLASAYQRLAPYQNRGASRDRNQRGRGGHFHRGINDERSRRR